MATEIERKYLVKNDSWRGSVEKSVTICQGYLAGSATSSVRVRIEDDQANLNIKSATLGIHRLEYEYNIPVAEAREMLDKLCDGPLIEKTRHHVPAGSHVWEVDVFAGDNAGLVVAEVELADESEQVALPDWVGEEVSGDPRYYNVRLSTHPYKDWRNKG